MNYEIIQMTDFDLTKLEIVKETVCWLREQDHSRWVLKTPMKPLGFWQTQLYLKIWNPTYIRRDNILTGIDVGFYDEQTTPALVGPIFHKGICRGYATSRCTQYWRRQWENRFYDLILQKSAKTGYFNCQYSRYHVMRYKGQPNLIDLEGIYPICELRELPKYDSRFDDRQYEDYIVGLYNERCNHRIEQSRNQTVGNVPVGRDKHSLKRAVYSLWNRSITLLKKGPQISSNHLYLIQK
jgi:hypothetical protein